MEPLILAALGAGVLFYGVGVPPYREPINLRLNS